MFFPFRFSLVGCDLECGVHAQMKHHNFFIVGLRECDQPRESAAVRRNLLEKRLQKCLIILFFVSRSTHAIDAQKHPYMKPSYMYRNGESEKYETFKPMMNLESAVGE